MFRAFCFNLNSIYLFKGLLKINAYPIPQTNMKNRWFINKIFTSLEIKKFKSISNHQIHTSVKINNEKIIQDLIARIEKINPNGEEMQSFAENAEYIELLFHSENQPQIIQIYQGKFKTPATGFNTGKNDVEMDLYNDITTLLSTTP